MESKRKILRIGGKNYVFSPKKLKKNLLKLVGILLFSVMILGMIAHAPKSPIEKWHDAIDAGMTWAEYQCQ